MRSVPCRKALVTGFVLMAVIPSVAAGQETACYIARGSLEEAAQRTSPLAETVLRLGGREVSVCYGRPSANGRVVMGDLVPFGQPWRVGANEATAIHLPFTAEVGGVELEPGSYSLYAMPGAREWIFFLNGNFERWGVPINDEVKATDVGSFTRPVVTTEEMVERLTIDWDSHGDGMGHLVIRWEHTRVEIPLHLEGMNQG
jgi:hypothetical protein